MGNPGIRQRGVSQKTDQRMRDEIYEFVLMGYPRSEILDYLELNYNIKPENGIHHYTQATLSIIELGEFDIDRIITQHIFYYEEAARFFDSIGDYTAKAKALGGKEKLLKLFEEEEHQIDIDNTVNFEITQLDYDMEKLDPKDVESFQNIFSKVKVLR